MYLIPIPAFADNYLWLLHDGQHALVVDPGDAEPVLQTLKQRALQLTSILVTHHHADHIGGIAALREATGATVYGPATERIPAPFTPLHGNDTLNLLGLKLQVIDVPGHTAGHIAFYAPDFDGNPLLFCGDTLFSGGCGRLFEGTSAQMLALIDKLAAIPCRAPSPRNYRLTLSCVRGKPASFQRPTALTRPPVTKFLSLPPSGSGKTNSNDTSPPTRTRQIPPCFPGPFSGSGRTHGMRHPVGHAG